MPNVVDGHLHLFRQVSDAFPRTAYPVMAEPDREELAEKLLGQMDVAGVDHAIVVPLSKDDEYLNEVLDTYPGRFAGVGCFDHEQSGLADVEARLAVVDLQGLRFFGLDAAEGAAPESLASFPVLEFMAERGMIVWFYGDEVQLRALDLVMQRLPTLQVVMNHLAFLPDMFAEMRIDEHRRPHFDVALPPAGLSAVEELAAKHQNLYVHFSGHYAFSGEPYPYRDLQDVSKRLLAAFGAERMLMASDWPWIEFEPGYAEVLATVDQLLPGLSPVERDAIRGGTALGLFRFVSSTDLRPSGGSARRSPVVDRLADSSGAGA